jgi:hypothetical protein
MAFLGLVDKDLNLATGDRQIAGVTKKFATPQKPNPALKDRCALRSTRAS